MEERNISLSPGWFVHLSSLLFLSAGQLCSTRAHTHTHARALLRQFWFRRDKVHGSSWLVRTCETTPQWRWSARVLADRWWRKGRSGEGTKLQVERLRTEELYENLENAKTFTLFKFCIHEKVKYCNQVQFWCTYTLFVCFKSLIFLFHNIKWSNILHAKHVIVNILIQIKL